MTRIVFLPLVASYLLREYGGNIMTKALLFIGGVVVGVVAAIAFVAKKFSEAFRF